MKRASVICTGTWTLQRSIQGGVHSIPMGTETKREAFEGITESGGGRKTSKFETF